MRRSHLLTDGHLDVEELTVSYGSRLALSNVGFACGGGEVVGVVGPNGAGKSTLLKAILGLIPVDSGRVHVDGHRLDAVRCGVAYLPQRSAIDWDFPALVREVVAMGRYPHAGLTGRLRPGDRAIVDDALARVGMADHRDDQLGELSGGQQQRVLFARSLAQQAALLLLDEPFAGVDALTAQVLRDAMRALAREGATVVVVDHDLATVGRWCDRLLVLARRVVAFGPPEQVFTGEVVTRAYGGLPPSLEVFAGLARSGA